MSAGVCPGFPEFAPAYSKPDTQPPKRQLYPHNGTKNYQVMDGHVHESEYVNGKMIKLDDWLSTPAMPQGTAHLVWTGVDLSIGIKVQPGLCVNLACGVMVLIDDDRDVTLANKMAEPMGVEDRGFMIWWTDDEGPSVAQFAPGYAPGTMPSSMQWPVKAAVGYHKDSVFGGSEKAHIEIRITLPHPEDFGNGPDQMPRSKPIGLAIGVAGNRTGNQCPSYFVWPNEPVKNYQWVALPQFPYTWATIDPTESSAPISKFATYNAAILPFPRLFMELTWFLPDPFDGMPSDFAAVAYGYGAMATCFQELWPHEERRQVADLASFHYDMYSVGRPNPCGEEDDDCGWLDFLADELGMMGWAVKDTGLLMVTKAPPIQENRLRFDSGCKGSDCFEEKGALHARVATANAIQEKNCPKPGNGSPDSCVQLYSHSKYIDVYCTHLQASCDDVAELAQWLNAIEGIVTGGISELLNLLGIDLFALHKLECEGSRAHEPIQYKQIVELGKFIEATRQKDRPAVVMGDFNINARNSRFYTSGEPTRLYEHLAKSIGAWDITPFEEKADNYSRRRDLGTGFKQSCDAVPPVCGYDSLLPQDMTQYAYDYPTMPIEYFGQGTKSGDKAYEYDAFSARYDHIWVIPADKDVLVPFYGIAMPGGHEPRVQVIPDTEVAFDTNRTTSDHAMVIAGIQFDELIELDKYNPAANHNVGHTIVHIKSSDGDGFL
ncbi:MAG: hypothetical protein FWD57_16720, partial [Polyangiaceae bacterium]|nr:hypothetical protein [Polyangiaceae bacterium]